MIVTENTPEFVGFYFSTCNWFFYFGIVLLAHWTEQFLLFWSCFVRCLFVTHWTEHSLTLLAKELIQVACSPSLRPTLSFFDGSKELASVGFQLSVWEDVLVPAKRFGCSVTWMAKRVCLYGLCYIIFWNVLKQFERVLSRWGFFGVQRWTYEMHTVCFHCVRKQQHMFGAYTPRLNGVSKVRQLVGGNFYSAPRVNIFERYLAKTICC